MSAAATQSLRDLQKDIWKCNKCGACTSVCPLYIQTRDEIMPARGKLALIDAMLEGKLEQDRGYSQCLDNCLLCQACKSVCASGVPTTDIFQAARRELFQSGKYHPLLRQVLRRILANPSVVGLGGAALDIYQRKGIGSLVRSSGLLRLMPSFLGQFAESNLSAAPTGIYSDKSFPRPATPRGTAGLFTGCAIKLFMPRVQLATGRLLSFNGWAVTAPRNFCCGVPHQAYGDTETALELARKNIDLFESMEVVVTDCATCGTALKGYGSLLADDDKYRDRARAFSAKVHDISEIIVKGDLHRHLNLASPAGKEGSIRVTYHDPCHLARSQGIRQQPRRLLKEVPGIELVEMERPDACCGGSGTFLFTHPDIAGRIGSAKVKDILDTGADVLVSGCPGCIMQLKLSLHVKRKGSIQVLHLTELLAQRLSLI